LFYVEKAESTWLCMQGKQIRLQECGKPLKLFNNKNQSALYLKSSNYSISKFNWNNKSGFNGLPEGLTY